MHLIDLNCVFKVTLAYLPSAFSDRLDQSAVYTVGGLLAFKEGWSNLGGCSVRIVSRWIVPHGRRLCSTGPGLPTLNALSLSVQGREFDIHVLLLLVL